jgi:hypothetical protein
VSLVQSIKRCDKLWHTKPEMTSIQQALTPLRVLAISNRVTCSHSMYPWGPCQTVSEIFHHRPTSSHSSPKSAFCVNSMATTTVRAVTFTINNKTIKGKPDIRLVAAHRLVSVKSQSRPEKEWKWRTSTESNLAFEFTSKGVAFPSVRVLMWSDTFSETTLLNMLTDHMQKIVRGGASTAQKKMKMDRLPRRLLNSSLIMQWFSLASYHSNAACIPRAFGGMSTKCSCTHASLCRPPRKFVQSSPRNNAAVGVELRNDRPGRQTTVASCTLYLQISRSSVLIYDHKPFIPLSFCVWLS